MSSNLFFIVNVIFILLTATSISNKETTLHSMKVPLLISLINQSHRKNRIASVFLQQKKNPTKRPKLSKRNRKER